MPRLDCPSVSAETPQAGGYAEVLSVFQEPGVMAQECRCSAGSTSESDKVEGSTTCAFEGSTSESDSQPEDTTHRRLILL